MTDKLLIRKTLRQFSEGRLTWREAAAELGVEDYSEILSLMHEYSVSMPVIEGKTTHKDFALLPPDAIEGG